MANNGPVKPLEKAFEREPFETYKVTMEVTVRRSTRNSPEKWDWQDLLGTDGTNDTMRSLHVEKIALDQDAVKDLTDDSDVQTIVPARTDK